MASHRDQNAELFLPAGRRPVPAGRRSARRLVAGAGARGRSSTCARSSARPRPPRLRGAQRRVPARRRGRWLAGDFDDARAVVALAREQPEAGRVAVLGHSAGGHLALYAAAEGGVDAVVALAAPSDLEARPGPETLALMGGRPTTVPDRYAAGSPIRRVPLGVPSLLVHGTRDDVVPPRRSRDFATAARAAGDDVTLVEPDADHREVVDPRHPAFTPDRRPGCANGIMRLLDGANGSLTEGATVVSMRYPRHLWSGSWRTDFRRGRGGARAPSRRALRRRRRGSRPPPPTSSYRNFHHRRRPPARPGRVRRSSSAC